jgi:hypothetical protein
LGGAEADIVLVGPVSCALDPFDGLDNIHCLRARPYEEMPAYGSGFDVALMPTSATSGYSTSTRSS